MTLGLEGDLTVEVSGEGLPAGTIVLANADGAVAGQKIIPSFANGSGETASSGELMDQMMGAGL